MDVADAGAPVLPDLDMWMKALSRQSPEPLVVHALRGLIERRRVFLLSWIRLGLLARVRDERQAARLEWVLSAFPDLPITTADQHQAAGIIRRLRDHRAVEPWRALMWAVAERLRGSIWSDDRRWAALAEQGCPMWTRGS